MIERSELISMFYDQLNELPVRKAIINKEPTKYINFQDIKRLKAYLLSIYALTKDMEEKE